MSSGLWIILAFLLAIVVVLGLARRLFSRADHGRKEVAPNAHSLSGQTGRIIQRVDPETGYARVMVAGDEWKALVDSTEPVELGDRIVVLDVQDATLTVAPQPLIGR